ncbi:hypothetical protein HY633_04980 [Candidatus Uhrbacteria bacterium]|nr:hypothetical protein [Candidatus Uhrbacteria bacterium]
MCDNACGCGPGGSKGQTCESKSCEWCRTPLGSGHTMACSLWVCGEVLFFLGIISLIAAWVTNYQGSTWLGFESDHLFHDATAFLILSLMAKMKMRSYKLKLKLSGGCGEGCGSGGCGGECGGDCGEGGCGPEGCK